MKIILVDNFNRESSSYPDILIAENVHQNYMHDIVTFLNSRKSEDGNCYFRIVEDDYKLKDYSPV